MPFDARINVCKSCNLVEYVKLNFKLERLFFVTMMLCKLFPILSNHPRGMEENFVLIIEIYSRLGILMERSSLLKRKQIITFSKMIILYTILRSKITSFD